MNKYIKFLMTVILISAFSFAIYNNEYNSNNILSAKDAQIELLITQNNEYMAVLETTINERDTAIAERDTAICERDTAIAERDTAIEAFNEIQILLNTALEQLTISQNQNEQDADTINQLNNNISNYLENIENLQLQLEESENLLVEAQNQNEQDADTINQLNNNISNYLENIENLQEQLAEAQSQLAELQAYIDSIQTQIDEIESLQVELDNARLQLEDAQLQLSIIEGQLSDYNYQIDTLNSEIENYQNQIADLENQISELQNQTDTGSNSFGVYLYNSSSTENFFYDIKILGQLEYYQPFEDNEEIIDSYYSTGFSLSGSLNFYNNWGQDVHLYNYNNYFNATDINLYFRPGIIMNSLFNVNITLQTVAFSEENFAWESDGESSFTFEFLNLCLSSSTNCINLSDLVGFEFGSNNSWRIDIELS